MSSFSRRRAALLLSLIALAGAGCTHPAPPDVPKPGPHGVSIGADGDVRGTVMYHPPVLPAKQPPPNPYTSVSDKFVIGKRQEMAWALAEIDDHAHLQAFHVYPVPDPTWKGYTKEKALAQALRQARFNAYLLEKYHARFCSQYHISYDQLTLIIKEGREKNWPMPTPPKDL